jgi:hypothetical protein
MTFNCLACVAAQCENGLAIWVAAAANEDYTLEGSGTGATPNEAFENAVHDACRGEA